MLKWVRWQMRAILKISVKQWKGLEGKGYEIASLPLKKLKAMSALEKRTWELKEGFLVLEATV